MGGRRGEIRGEVGGLGKRRHMGMRRENLVKE